jgi:phosphoglycolate phosphatase-like HAD superfamily hydrolase/ribonuclease HI
MPELRLPDGTVAGRALIFDKDGVLVDFHRFWGEVSRLRVRHLAQRAGLSEADAALLTQELGIRDGRVDPTGPLAVGTRIEEESIASAFLYRRGMPWITARPLVEEAFDAAEGDLDWGLAVQPLGNVADLLARLAEDGWKLAIATSDLRRNAARHAELLGFDAMLGAIAGSDSVSRSKPHADLVLACSETLGIPPSECLVIGDTVADLLMAKAAGCAAAIGVLSGVSPLETLEPYADAVLDGVWELPALSHPTPQPSLPAIEPERRYVLSTDGASKGNPGPAGLGFVIAAEDGQVLREIAEPLGVTTNNVAEYQAVIRGLLEAERMGIRRLLVRSDSQLVIRQLQGAYAVRHEALIPLYHQVRDLLGNFRDVRLEHVERRHNARADALANEGVLSNQDREGQGG